MRYVLSAWAAMFCRLWVAASKQLANDAALCSIQSVPVVEKWTFQEENHPKGYVFIYRLDERLLVNASQAFIVFMVSGRPQDRAGGPVRTCKARVKVLRLCRSILRLHPACRHVDIDPLGFAASLSVRIQSAKK